MSLLYPFALILLPLVGCFIYCKSRPVQIYFSKPQWLPKSFIQFDLDRWIVMSVFVLLVFVLATPYLYTPHENNDKKGRDLVLAIDTSGSMAQSGFDSDNQFKSKYDTAMELAQAFIKQRFDDNIAAVIFGSYAYIASPLTYDLKGLSEMLELMSSIGIAGDSTAIGEALFQSIQALKGSSAKNKVIVLLSDGVHNAGFISPKDALKMAKEKNIKVYTIGIGESYDKEMLTTIAKESKGKSFEAKSAKDLKQVFEKIEALEPSPLRSEGEIGVEKLHTLPLLLAMVLMGYLVLRDRVWFLPFTYQD
ncbi:MAG: VWA domain-containing protein [Campylobacterales bacterium]|nr:VWA domain-containing protein [Campylobacterales bacterium]